jgi:hypothetical protein
MDNKIKMLIVGSIGMIFSGCASKYSITYNTNPTGASIICNGTNEGYSPVTLYYQPDEDNKKSGTMRTTPCSSYWVSGMRKDFSNTWDLNKFPDGVMQTLQRPNGDGYEKDAQFALQVKNMKYQQRQAEAAEDAAYQQRRNANANKKQARELNNMNNYLRYGY